MVTYSDLFQFVIMLCAVITLAVVINGDVSVMSLIKLKNLAKIARIQNLTILPTLAKWLISVLEQNVK